MLNLLRRINWPIEIFPVGGMVSGKLIGQVFDYESLMEIAKENASRLELDLRRKMLKEAELTREQIARSVKDDLSNLKQELIRYKRQITQNSMAICTQISKTAVSSFLTNLSDEIKIKSMVEILLPKLYSTREIIFTAHPSQVSTLRSVLENYFKDALGKDEYQVVEDRTLERDLVRVRNYKDAFIEISMKNILAILAEEVDYLESDLAHIPIGEVRNSLSDSGLSKSSIAESEELKQ